MILTAERNAQRGTVRFGRYTTLSSIRGLVTTSILTMVLNDDSADAADHTRDVSVDEAVKRSYDAVIVPGGGLDAATGTPHPWVKARLDLALRLDPNTRYHIVLSRGTTHRPSPTTSAGFAIDESAASAAYLLGNGVKEARRILQDNWSLDTIGNAYFTRQMCTEPMGLSRLIVITSAFHMPRTRAIFEWVFSLPSGSNITDGSTQPSPPTLEYNIDYCIADNDGMSDEQAGTRSAKEQQSLQTLREKTIPRVQTLQDLATFLLVDHGAYSSDGVVKRLHETKPEDTTSCLQSTY